jgi:protein pelota
MRILQESLKDNFLKLRVDNLDDLWIMSKILDMNDILSGDTSRITKKSDEQEGKRKKVFLKIIVEKIDFEKHVDVLRVMGTITESANTDITNGSYHTFSISPNDTIGITKEFKKWQIDRIKESVATTSLPKVLLCAADYGEAYIAVLHEFGLKEVTDINRTISGKKKENLKVHEKDKDDFLIELAKALENVSENQKLNNIIIGSMGFFSENFDKALEKFPSLRKKITFVKISSTGKSGVNEIIKRGAVESVVKGSRVNQETEIIERFLVEVAREGLAAYGIEDVKEALGYGAVDVLLVPDIFIKDYKEHGKYDELDELMQNAEKQGARVMMISSEHEAGEQLSKMGIAALLRFKV